MSKKKQELINVVSSQQGTWRDDWRLMGQEGYLMNKTLHHRQFDRVLVREDYDQCEFCWSLFDEDPLRPLDAYYDPESHVWICEECFRDFKDHFNWTTYEVV